MYLVKDKAGKQFLVALYLDTGVEIPSIWKKHCFPGSVIAIMYATRHFFMDGQHGIRVEELENVKVSKTQIEPHRIKNIIYFPLDDSLQLGYTSTHRGRPHKANARPVCILQKSCKSSMLEVFCR